MIDLMERRMARMATASFAILMAAGIAALAAPADRPRDKDVKQLIERIDHERDRFEDQLSGQLKHSVIRGPSGEVDVARYLDDLQDNIGKLKDRFTAEYAASEEATVVLRQASDIQRFISAQPPNFDGASEWNRLAGSLSELAAVYGTSFPISAGQQARRMNDREVKSSVEGVAKSADRFKNELDDSLKKDKTVDKAARETAVRSAEGLKKDAERLASTIDDEKPASGEAKALLQQASAIRAASSAHALSPAAQASWASVEGGLDKVAQAFSLPAR
jgi:hypothetical protein